MKSAIQTGFAKPSNTLRDRDPSRSIIFTNCNIPARFTALDLREEERLLQDMISGSQHDRQAADL
jgi:hypothetical protein